MPRQTLILIAALAANLAVCGIGAGGASGPAIAPRAGPLNRPDRQPDHTPDPATNQAVKGEGYITPIIMLTNASDDPTDTCIVSIDPPGAGQGGCPGPIQADRAGGEKGRGVASGSLASFTWPAWIAASGLVGFALGGAWERWARRRRIDRELARRTIRPTRQLTPEEFWREAGDAPRLFRDEQGGPRCP